MESADGSGESEVAGYDITVYIIGNPNDFFHHPPPFPLRILKNKKKKQKKMAIRSKHRTDVSTLSPKISMDLIQKRNKREKPELKAES